MCQKCVYCSGPAILRRDGEGTRAERWKGDRTRDAKKTNIIARLEVVTLVTVDCCVFCNVDTFHVSISVGLVCTSQSQYSVGLRTPRMTLLLYLACFGFLALFSPLTFAIKIL